MFIQLLKVFFIAMLPVIELRGALPVSQALGLPLALSYVVCVIGNMVPVPFIYLFARKVLEWGAQKSRFSSVFSYFLTKGERAGQKLEAQAGNGVYLALLLFVGVPLPGTGAWTGTLAASFLELDFKRSVIAVMGGVLLAGIIMAIPSFGLFKLLAS